ncbi:MAG TPA: four-carbon acid sugar kinase family protein [Conexibacter sp.]|nr:four-carbon acid sugar kinase family protein [Conexibacter sp.]
MSRPWLTWYADDFTGATDALDALTRGGVRAALFIAPPTRAQLAELGDYEAVGVAGATRTLPEDELRREVRSGLTALAALEAPLCHYKVCSTFDSAPHAGSVGAATEEGLRALGGAWVPLLVGVPALGRWCVFGNLFARVGADGGVRRLDRHPIAEHPVTPMREADLLRHLAAQTDLPSGLVLTHLAGAGSVERQLGKLRADGARVCLLDVADAEDLAAAGAAIATAGASGEVRLVVGSSGVEYALVEHWQRRGVTAPRAPILAEPVERLVVLSGSCSEVTGRQVAWAAANGFEELALDTPALLGDGADALLADAAERLDAALGAGRSVVVHTAVGPRDPRVAAVRERAGGGGVEAVVGPALARLGEQAVARGDVRRLLFTGGDTSSAGARALGIAAVDVSAPMLPGAPLCRAHAPGRAVDGLELLFKGGGLGEEGFFARVRDGVAAERLP